MKRYVLVFLSLLMVALSPVSAVDTTLFASPRKPLSRVQAADSTQSKVDSLALANFLVFMRYTARFDSLRLAVAAPAPRTTTTLSPYFYRMLVPGTLYSKPVRSRMQVTWSPSSLDTNGSQSIFPTLQDAELMRAQAADYALATIYTHHPTLIQRTEQEVTSQGSLRSDAIKQIDDHNRLSDHAINVDLSQADVEPLKVTTRRPHFWKVSGNGSLQFTQSYFSDNWFQGGEKNYSGLAQVSINANYNNQRKLTWENRIDVQLGFQTARSDTVHVFRVTSNLLRYYTKIGYRAAKNWSYTASVNAQTQIYPNYQSNTRKVTTDFLSPLNVTVGPGIDWRFNKKKFSGSITINPLAYSMRYVQRPSLIQRYGNKENHHFYHSFGPNVVINYNWNVVKNVSWNGRIYWFSNLSYTNIEWENTISFTINKYLNAKLYVYPKFDDSSKRYKSEKFNYVMMKEWLSLGLTYSW